MGNDAKDAAQPAMTQESKPGMTQESEAGHDAGVRSPG